MRLEDYLQHDADCVEEVWHGKGPMRCSCGLYEAKKELDMILDAATMAKMIRSTAKNIEKKKKGVSIEPSKSIQEMLEELAQSFDRITNQAQMRQEEKPTP